MKPTKHSNKPNPGYLSIRLDDLLPKTSVIGGKTKMIFGAPRHQVMRVNLRV